MAVPPIAGPSTDLAATMSVAEVIGLAQAHFSAGNPDDAFAAYARWIEANPGDPLLHAVIFNYGTALADYGRQLEAIQVFKSGIEKEPAFFPTYINLGNAYERTGQPVMAIAVWREAANYWPQLTGENIGHKLTAMKQIARVLETGRLEAEAEDVLARSLEIDPRQRDVLQHWIALRQSQCKWPAIAEFGRVTMKDLMGSISPLSIAVDRDDPLAQLANSYRYFTNDIGLSQHTDEQHSAPPVTAIGRRLRIGYLSSDLREHAVGFLMSEVFELHDRKEVEVFAYYCGIPSSDMTHKRFQSSADHFVDISGMTDQEAVHRIRSDGIDILVDLNGYTKDARLKVVAARPAPIIVNWLGFPGTMASPNHNYIIADPITIPEGFECFYTEKVLRLPCYQPNDRQRHVDPVRPTRRIAGLPDDAFVYCCFNSSQKIKSETFELWIEILRRTNGSILWILSGQGATNTRLKDYAIAAGIDPGRLIFAPRMGNPQHLARFPLADLFLDTFPYGAHTTASDALWMGVPVVTRIGSTFAARVCASLVTAAGLPELVCETDREYVELAVALYQNRARLDAIKSLLTGQRDSCLLFDTPRIVRALEQLYREMDSDLRSGMLPRPDLTNLGALSAISLTPEITGATCLSASQCIEAYQLGLERAGYRSAALQIAENIPRVLVSNVAPHAPIPRATAA